MRKIMVVFIVFYNLNLYSIHPVFENAIVNFSYCSSSVNAFDNFSNQHSDFFINSKCKSYTLQFSNNLKIKKRCFLNLGLGVMTSVLMPNYVQGENGLNSFESNDIQTKMLYLKIQYLQSFKIDVLKLNKNRNLSVEFGLLSQGVFANNVGVETYSSFINSSERVRFENNTNRNFSMNPFFAINTAPDSGRRGLFIGIRYIWQNRNYDFNSKYTVVKSIGTNSTEVYEGKFIGLNNCVEFLIGWKFK